MRSSIAVDNIDIVNELKYHCIRMQENSEVERINKLELTKRQTKRGLLFIWQNPACSIPCATGCCSVIFVVGLGLFFMILYYFTQY